ncbi:1658_t:CDS:1 [Paraglomus occultum]|uniref:1658_t:CDS:1 n=1 Tax=Paraglomus occultum TaxID=144539 RepID=A0A9N8ZZD8_9GLOM|nr:1658_t:CDS:1 [Paraglomus occultum]
MALQKRKMLAYVVKLSIKPPNQTYKSCVSLLDTKYKTLNVLQQMSFLLSELFRASSANARTNLLEQACLRKQAQQPMLTLGVTFVSWSRLKNGQRLFPQRRKLQPCEAKLRVL